MNIRLTSVVLSFFLVIFLRISINFDKNVITLITMFLFVSRLKMKVKDSLRLHSSLEIGIRTRAENFVKK